MWSVQYPNFELKRISWIYIYQLNVNNNRENHTQLSWTDPTCHQTQAFPFSWSASRFGSQSLPLHQTLQIQFFLLRNQQKLKERSTNLTNDEKQVDWLVDETFATQIDVFEHEEIILVSNQHVCQVFVAFGQSRVEQLDSWRVLIGYERILARRCRPIVVLVVVRIN